MSLWRSWAIAIGAWATLVFLSLLVDSRCIPIAALLFALILLRLDSRNKKSESPECFIIPQIAIVTLLLSAIVTLISTSFLSVGNVYEWSGQPANPDNPSITILILAPITSLIAFFYIVKHKAAKPSSINHIKGIPIDHVFLREIYYKESAYQTRLLFWLSLMIATVSWLYYCTNYINVNINQTDSFFFNYFPVMVYVLSLIYLGRRYYIMWSYYCKPLEEGTKISGQNGTVIRFMILHEDSIFLTTAAAADTNDQTHTADTPLKISLPLRETISTDEAAAIFKGTTGITPNSVKFLYESYDYDVFNNVFHYCAFLSGRNSLSGYIDGEWLTYGQVRQMTSCGLVAPALAAELKRIYTIAMAWKTYDKNGFRLYDIKHYKPTFRFKDIKDWDVDFNDNNWLIVAMRNQDRRFFRLRRWLANILTAI